jgi:hypothetical protein
MSAGKRRGPARLAVEACLKLSSGWISARLLRDLSQVDDARFQNAIKVLRRTGLLERRGQPWGVEYRYTPEREHQARHYRPEQTRPARRHKPPADTATSASTDAPLRQPGSTAPVRRPVQPAPKPVEIIYPEGYRHEVITGALSDRPTWRGTDWRAATARPDCLDASRVPSRRGDHTVPYSTPLHNGPSPTPKP